MLSSKKLVAMIMAIIFTASSCMITFADGSDKEDLTDSLIIEQGTYAGYTFEYTVGGASATLISTSLGYEISANLHLHNTFSFVYQTTNSTWVNYMSGQSYSTLYGGNNQTYISKNYTVSQAASANYLTTLPAGSHFKYTTKEFKIGSAVVASVTDTYHS